MLTLQLSAQQAGKAIFQIQIDQAGLFSLQNVSEDQQEVVLYGVCANALFPYVNVILNQTLSQAGLPPLYLNPLDFVKLYHEHKKQEQEEADQTTEAMS